MVKLEYLGYLLELPFITGEMKGLNYNIMMLIQYKCWYKFARSHLDSS